MHTEDVLRRAVYEKVNVWRWAFPEFLATQRRIFGVDRQLGGSCGGIDQRSGYDLDGTTESESTGERTGRASDHGSAG